MSFFGTEMEPLVEVFQSETADLIKELEQDLEKIRQQGTLDKETINGIFRVVHTIKSSTAMMGLSALSSGTHRLEELFLKFRDDPALCISQEKELQTLLYDYADFVRDEAEKMSDADYAPAPLDALAEEIERGIRRFDGQEEKKAPAQQGAPVTAPAEAAPEKDVSGTQSGTLALRVKFKANCPLVGVRAVLLLKQIKPACRTLKWKPEDLKAESAVDRLKTEGLRVYADASQPEAVTRRFANSPYVESVVQETAPAKTETVPQKAGEQPQKAADAGLKTSKFCTLPWEKIVRLQKIAEELIVSQTLLENLVAGMDDARELDVFTQSLKRTLGDLEQVVDAVALTPVSSVKAQLNRIVRDICKKENKEVAFTIQGEEIEADKNLIDMMLNPLMHVIRNAIDHGIEPAEERRKLGKDPCGRVTLSVSSNGSMLLFRVRDDGGGIDPEVILEHAARKNLLTRDRASYTQEEVLNLITLPGFSTTRQANEFSGRGVGMDVVRSSMESLGGVLTVKSEKGKGSTFDMQVPVSMTAVESMCFRVGETTCLLPITAIERVYSLAEAQDRLFFVDGQEMFREQSLIPVLRMAEVFGVPEKERAEEYLMVLKGIKADLCIVVGDITGQQTAVTKKLPTIFRQERGGETGISGAVVIGNGALGMMLNTERLIEVHRKGQNS